MHEDASVALFTRQGSPHGTLSCREGSVVALFGEIYNLQEVWPAPDGSGDAMASLHDLAWSPRLLEVLPRLNGSFLIVACDGASERLRLIPDRHGSWKCFVGERDGALWFFPHLHYFLGCGFRARIDRELLVQYLTLTWLFAGRTVVEGVRSVPHGTVLEASRDGIEHHRYWAWRFDESRQELDDPAAAVAELDRLWMRAVERRLADKSRVVVPISGGLDSRAILAAAVECKPADDILGVTFGTPGTFDYELGRLCAQAAGVRHKTIDLSTPRDYRAEYLRHAVDTDGLVGIFWPFLSDWAVLASHSRDLAVGFMGDLLMGTKMPKRPFSERPDDEHAALAAARDVRQDIPTPIAARLCGLGTAECDELILDLMAATNHGNPHRILANYAHCWDIPARQGGFTAPLVLRLREDFHYLFPFLDTELVDFLLRLPVAWRKGQRLYRRSLVERFPLLAGLPTTRLHGGALTDGAWARARRSFAAFLRKHLERASLGAIPAYTRHKEALRRKRVNTLDYGLLMQADPQFQALCQTNLSRLAERGVLNADAIHALWREHLAGQARHDRVLMVLTCIEFIFATFVDRR